MTSKSAKADPDAYRYPPDPPRGSITEGLDIIPAFSALIREGKSAQYCWVHVAAREVTLPFLTFNGADGYRKEWAGAAGLTGGDWPREPERTAPTFLRVVRVWMAATERPCTEKESAERRDAMHRVGMEVTENATFIGTELHLASGPDDERFRAAFPAVEYAIDQAIRTSLKLPEVTDEERYTRWIEEFTAEVEVCIERFKDHKDLPHQQARLIERLRTFEIGSNEGRDYIAAMRATSTGEPVLNTLNDCKAELLRRLEQMVVKPTATATSKLTHPPPVNVIARFCWCMEKTGDKRYLILQRSDAIRIADEFGSSGRSPAQRLKEEANRIAASDGRAYLLNPNTREHTARRMWSRVAELLRSRGEFAAAGLAEQKIGEL